MVWSFILKILEEPDQPIINASLLIYISDVSFS
jgi:hypothetical protein